MNMNFDFNSPTKILFGSGKLNELGSQPFPYPTIAPIKRVHSNVRVATFSSTFGQLGVLTVARRYLQ